MYGELVMTILKSFLFGLMSGLFNLVAVWITYMGYATMHFCQVMIVIFSALMDVVFAAISWNRIKLYLQADEVKMVIFWVIFAFAVIKFIVAILAYSSFKRAFT